MATIRKRMYVTMYIDYSYDDEEVLDSQADIDMRTALDYSHERLIEEGYTDSDASIECISGVEMTSVEDMELTFEDYLCDVSSTAELYQRIGEMSVHYGYEIGEKYRFAVDAIAYFVFGDTKSILNCVYQMLHNSVHPGNGARLEDDSMPSAITLDYEYSWREEEQLKMLNDALGNMMLKNGEEAKYWY